MSRILLVDDSPHAQRMGERILSEEGFEVVTVSNADSALIRLDDVDPDLVIADTVMPGRSGYDICQFLKLSPRHRHVRVVLTAGVLEPLDEEQVVRVQADATLKKPFEASMLVATVRPLAERAAADRAKRGSPSAPPGAFSAAPRTGAMPFAAVVDAEQVHAAVTIALDAAMEKMVDEIAARVLLALQPRKTSAAASAATSAPPVLAGAAPLHPHPLMPLADPPPAKIATHAPLAAPPPQVAPKPLMPIPPPAKIPVAPAAASSAPPPAATPDPLAHIAPAAKVPLAPAAASSAPPPVVTSHRTSLFPPSAKAPAAPASSSSPPPRIESVRRVNTLRSRPGSILGLDLSFAETEAPATAPHSSIPDPLFPNARPLADPDPAQRASGSQPPDPESPPPHPESNPARPDKP